MQSENFPQVRYLSDSKVYIRLLHTIPPRTSAESEVVYTRTMYYVGQEMKFFEPA